MADGMLLSEEVRRRRIQEDLLSGEDDDSEDIEPEIEEEEPSEGEPDQEPEETQQPSRYAERQQEPSYSNDLSLDDYAQLPSAQAVVGLPGEQEPEAPPPQHSL